MRKCSNPAPANSGKDCSRLGPSVESGVCNTHPCPGRWIQSIITQLIWNLRPLPKLRGTIGKNSSRDLDLSHLSTSSQRDDILLVQCCRVRWTEKVFNKHKPLSIWVKMTPFLTLTQAKVVIYQSIHSSDLAGFFTHRTGTPRNFRSKLLKLSTASVISTSCRNFLRLKNKLLQVVQLCFTYYWNFLFIVWSACASNCKQNK